MTDSSPSPEAREAVRALRLPIRDPETVARLLDEFARQAVERERARCAGIIERDSQAPRRSTYGELKAAIKRGETL